MKKRTIIILLSILLALVVFAGLLYTGIVNLFPKRTISEATALKKAILYAEFKDNNYILVGEDGLALLDTTTKPGDSIPQITGLVFESIIINDTPVAVENAYYEYAFSVAKYLREAGIEGITEIHVSEQGELTMYVDKVTIELGEDVDTAAKISALGDFYDKVKDRDGTLNMKELADPSVGYTFKITQEETTAETTAENEEGEQEDPEENQEYNEEEEWYEEENDPEYYEEPEYEENYDPGYYEEPEYEEDWGEDYEEYEEEYDPEEDWN